MAVWRLIIFCMTVERFYFGVDVMLFITGIEAERYASVSKFKSMLLVTTPD